MRRSRDKSYGLTFYGQYILLLHTKMTPYNIRPFRLLTDRFRCLFSVFAALRHEINVSVFIFSARGEHWGQTLSECACELSLPVPSLPLPATKCCLYVSLKLAPLTQNAITSHGVGGARTRGGDNNTFFTMLSSFDYSVSRETTSIG